ncbi:MAG: hypothetical protein JSR80_05070 [Verrucomicrobia bacterium]|nr:hypothetical protein [Verrucomicrobiota bacterium]
MTALEERLVFPQLGQSPGFIWSLLLHRGYLTIDATPSYGTEIQLNIPHFEVSEKYALELQEQGVSRILCLGLACKGKEVHVESSFT